MDKEAVQIVMDKLEVLASKLGVTGEYMLGVYVRQAVVTGVTNLILTVIVVIVALGLAFWAYKRLGKDTLEEDEIISLFILSLVTIVFLSICFFGKIPEAVTCFYNPEYFALKQLLKILN